jgi:predicted double-glycine peptidase
MRQLLLFCCCLSLWSCASTPTWEGSGQQRPSHVIYVDHIPFYPQLEYQCGPASLAAVLNYWGKNVTPEDIAGQIYSPKLKGTLSLDMWQYALSQNMDAEMHNATLEHIREHLLRREPVIVFLKLGYQWLPVGHFVVVVGLDAQDKSVIMYSGRQKNSRMRYERFLSAWEKTKYWSLVVRSKKADQPQADFPLSLGG